MLYFASAYPVQQLATIVRTVAAAQTRNVLRKYRAKSKLLQALAYPEKFQCLGSSVNG